MRVLAGDIGGTNVRLAVVDVAQREGRLEADIVAQERVAVADHDGLTAPLRAFLARQGEVPQRACFGIAGTIEGRVIRGVNLPWVIDADALEESCGVEEVTLVNDFQAAARGIEVLGPDDLLALNAGVPVEGAPRAILGAGTGLGQAFLLPEADGTWRVVGTEGGHRGFGPQSLDQDRVLDFLRRRHGGRVSTERVLSGPGLEAIYEALLVDGRAPANDVDDQPPAERAAAISRVGLAGEHMTCADAVRIFVEVYGAEASNVALTVLAAGGVYVAGGIAPVLFAHEPARAVFRAAFRDKGRFSEWCGQVPVWCITNRDLGLLGAACEAASTR